MANCLATRGKQEMFSIHSRSLVITYLCVKKKTVAGADLPGILTYCGLIFVGKEYTTKSTKIYTPRKFLRVRYYHFIF